VSAEPPRDATLRTLAPTSVEELLTELVFLSHRWKEGLPVRRPEVTLHLRTGRDVRGILLDRADRTRGGPTVLVHVFGQGSHPEYDVAYVPAVSIEAVTIHDLPSMGQSTEGTPPGRMELRRRATELGGKLAAAIGRELAAGVSFEDAPESDGPGNALAHLLGAAEAVLGALAADETGRAALREKVSRVELKMGTPSGATLDAGKLSLRTAVEPARWQTRDELRASIESIL
jgi:hypothetical protein